MRSTGPRSWPAPTTCAPRELQAFFADPEVDAIFAARGGYGAGRILPLLDFAAIARTPKVFMGFSDATFILNALVGRAGMVCFHGPMVAMDFARGLREASLDHLRRLLAGETGSFELPARAALKGRRRRGRSRGRMSFDGGGGDWHTVRAALRRRDSFFGRYRRESV